MPGYQPPDFSTLQVAEVFEAWPVDLRDKILGLRNLIFQTAQTTLGVGQIEETLKWGVPAYLTAKPKSGTTLRLEGKADTGVYGVYVPCSTSLVETCRSLYPQTFKFEKNRGLVFDIKVPVPEVELRHFIAMALTYHLK